MALKISNEIRTAILGILAIALFVFGFSYLKGSGLLNSSKIMYAVYDNAKGLTPSSFVQIQGVTVGSVREIRLSKRYPGKVEVEFSLNKDIEIASDSKAMITSSDLLGTKALTLIPGTSGIKASNGSILAVQEEVGMLDKFAKTGDRLDPTIANIDGAVTAARTALGTIDATVANVNSIVDTRTKQGVQTSIAGVQKSVQDFNLLSAELAAQRAKIAAMVSSLEQFTKNLNANNAAINASVANVQTVTNKLSSADFAGTVENLRATVSQLNTTLSKVNSTDGSIGMLLNDKKLYNDLQGSLHSLDALLQDMKANPHRYVSFSLISRKPKPASTSN